MGSGMAQIVVGLSTCGDFRVPPLPQSPHGDVLSPHIAILKPSVGSCEPQCTALCPTLFPFL